MSRTRFCAECGKINVPLHENFCQDCYWKFHNLATFKTHRVELPYCLECGAIKLKSGWTGPNFKEEIPETIAFAYFNNINTDAGSTIDIYEISDLNWVNPNPDFIIRYSVVSDLVEEFDPYEVILDFEVKILGGSCSTCIKKKTGSGEVTVQFRAKNRKISKEEMDTATTIAFTQSSTLSYESKEAYISDIVEAYGGLDFYFGSDSVADAFIENVKSKWIGHYEKNYKLVTEDKDERRIYSVTHLFRLPEVQIGDYVQWEDELHIVRYISKAGIHLQSLMDWSRTLTKEWKDLKPLDPPPLVQKKMVISEDIDGNSYLLMDLTNYDNREVGRQRFPVPLTISSEIEFLEWDDKLYLLPEIEN